VTPGHSVFDPFGPLPLEVYYFGSSGADVAIAGARGIDMNGDGDVDVKSLVAPIARYSFYGEAGPDRLSGAGSRVTGVAVTGQIVTRGGVGRDVLEAEPPATCFSRRGERTRSSAGTATTYS
jgi:hypothetical protein